MYVNFFASMLLLPRQQTDLFLFQFITWMNNVKKRKKKDYFSFFHKKSFVIDLVVTFQYLYARAIKMSYAAVGSLATDKEKKNSQLFQFQNIHTYLLGCDYSNSRSARFTIFLSSCWIKQWNRKTINCGEQKEKKRTICRRLCQHLMISFIFAYISYWI